jgi:hypothetical protein
LLEVEVKPTGLNFGNLAKNQTGSRDLFVTVMDPKKVQISTLTVGDKRFSIEPGRVDSKGTAHYQVNFLGSDKIGRISEKIKMILEGSATPQIEVPIQVIVVSDLLYNRSLDFRQQGGAYAPQEVDLKTRSGIPVEILSVEDKDGLLKAEILERNGHRSVLKAQVADPKSVPYNQRRHTLIVSTNHEDEPTLVISYRIALPGTR